MGWRAVSLAIFVVTTPAIADMPSALWHHDITTSLFWRGNASTPTFSLKPNAEADSAGLQPSRRSVGDAFYVALPFDDLKHPDLTARWVPQNWIADAKEMALGTWQNLHAGAKTLQVKWEPVSACLRHWVEIRAQNGKVCCARWTDVGPGRDDDAAYVFGPARPAHATGLDISPAMAHILRANNLDHLDWRFVDEKDAPRALGTRPS